MRKRTSAIWKMDKDEFRNLVEKSNTVSDILRSFNMQNKGGNFRTVKKRILEDGLDFNRLKINGRNKMLKGIIKKAIPFSEVMVKNSSYSRGTLKKRLLREGILKNICEICGQKDQWKDQKLVMILDHKNGNSEDHRIGNLRMVCPNCNSQLDTFAGKRLRGVHLCKNCGKNKKTKKSNLCIKCWRKLKSNQSKIIDREELIQIIDIIPMTKIAEKYGVSDKTIKKWCKKLNIPISNGRRYWAKVYSKNRAVD